MKIQQPTLFIVLCSLFKQRNILSLLLCLQCAQASAYSLGTPESELSATTTFQTTSLYLSSPSSKVASEPSANTIGISVSPLPSSGIVSSPAQMANTLAGRNIPNPGDDDITGNDNPVNGTPVGNVLPLFLLAIGYALIKLMKRVQRVKR